jgi:hypothetical protein
MFGGFPNIIQGFTGERSWEDVGKGLVSPVWGGINDSQSYEDNELYDYVSGNLTGASKEYWDSLSPSAKKAFIENNFTDTEENLWGDTYEIDTEDLISELSSLNDYGNFPDMPSYEDAVDDVLDGNDRLTNEYLASLAEEEVRQSQLMQAQLAENKASFDDYRSQILSNQYQQNAQLMGAYSSEMSKARRSALEAGASAGLRMAENINTTLAMQNKQSQISLETSNQLAQQLLNQRQAATGIRGDYNAMLSDNARESRQYKDNAVNRVYGQRMSDYGSKVDAWNTSTSDNIFADSYTAHAQKKQQSQYNK